MPPFGRKQNKIRKRTSSRIALNPSRISIDFPELEKERNRKPPASLIPGNISLWEQLLAEFDDSDFEIDFDKTRRVLNFLQVPLELEGMLWFGFFITLV
jgi:hypothetical protein